MSSTNMSSWNCKACHTFDTSSDTESCIVCHEAWEFGRDATEIANRDQTSAAADELATALSSLDVEDIPVKLCEHQPDSGNPMMVKVDCKNCGSCDPALRPGADLWTTVQLMRNGTRCWFCGTEWVEDEKKMKMPGAGISQPTERSENTSRPESGPSNLNPNDMDVDEDSTQNAAARPQQAPPTRQRRPGRAPGHMGLASIMQDRLHINESVPRPVSIAQASFSNDPVPARNSIAELLSAIARQHPTVRQHPQSPLEPSATNTTRRILTPATRMQTPYGRPPQRQQRVRVRTNFAEASDRFDAARPARQLVRPRDERADTNGSSGRLIETSRANIRRGQHGGGAGPSPLNHQNRPRPQDFIDEEDEDEEPDRSKKRKV